jgi:hypothetical protein
MAHFADGTRYSYGAGPVPGEGEAINVGWRDRSHPYPQGEVPHTLVAALCELGRHSVNYYRGYHHCELCPRLKTADGHLPPTVAPCETSALLSRAFSRVGSEQTDSDAVFAPIGPSSLARSGSVCGALPWVGRSRIRGTRQS